MNSNTVNSRSMMYVFAHPDDETSSCAGTIIRYAHKGIDQHVVTATRGEKGTLGTNDYHIRREDLPVVRETELETVLQMYGAQPPKFLNYIDGEVSCAPAHQLTDDVYMIMHKVKPDIVITFGPTGISHHKDHIAIHTATLEAFRLYIKHTNKDARLFYVAIPESLAIQMSLNLHEAEMDPTVIVDIHLQKNWKIQGLRTYRSQQDAQELADMFEADEFSFECFHQAYPPSQGSKIAYCFWG